MYIQFFVQYSIVDRRTSPFVVSHRQAQCDHAEAVAEVERAIHRNRDFLHVRGSQDGLRMVWIEWLIDC